jgi:hypothetical protein
MSPSCFLLQFFKPVSFRIALSQSLQKMVGFRNIAVHEYQKLNVKILAYYRKPLI